MILTKIISTAIEKGRLIIKVLGLGSSDVKTIISVQPFGIDANPIRGYRGIYASTSSKEDKILIGVILEKAISGVGELRLHSEDSGGEEKATIFLKNDGVIELNGNTDFAVRFSELETGFNNLKQDFNTFLTTIYNMHVHPGVTTGSGSTAVTPTIGTESTADISGAKIDNIKTN